jgi:hypothetical protein
MLASSWSANAIHPKRDPGFLGGMFA